MRRIMYKVYVGKCTVGQDMKPSSQLASQPVTFFLPFFFLGEEKKIIIRRNILKSEKKVHCENKISLFFVS